MKISIHRNKLRFVLYPSAAWRYWRLSDPFCSERGGDGFWMTRTTPETCPFPLEDQHPHLILGPTRVFIQNSMSIGSAICAQLTTECPITSQCAATFPHNCPFPLGFRHPARGGPSHGHGSMHRKIDKDRACGSWQTDRQTHRQTHRHAHRNTSSPLPRAKLLSVDHHTIHEQTVSFNITNSNITVSGICNSDEIFHWQCWQRSPNYNRATVSTFGVFS